MWVGLQGWGFEEGGVSEGIDHSTNLAQLSLAQLVPLVSNFYQSGKFFQIPPPPKKSQNQPLTNIFLYNLMKTRKPGAVIQPAMLISL